MKKVGHGFTPCLDFYSGMGINPIRTLILGFTPCLDFYFGMGINPFRTLILGFTPSTISAACQ